MEYVESVCPWNVCQSQKKKKTKSLRIPLETWNVYVFILKPSSGRWMDTAVQAGEFQQLITAHHPSI